MAKFSLSHPISIPSGLVEEISIARPSVALFQQMREVRPPRGFTVEHLYIFGARLSHYGERTLRRISKSDRPKLALAVERAFITAWRDANHRRGAR
jgi:hypothetical protein